MYTLKGNVKTFQKRSEITKLLKKRGKYGLEIVNGPSVLIEKRSAFHWRPLAGFEFRPIRKSASTDFRYLMISTAVLRMTRPSAAQ